MEIKGEISGLSLIGISFFFRQFGLLVSCWLMVNFPCKLTFSGIFTFLKLLWRHCMTVMLFCLRSLLFNESLG